MMRIDRLRTSRYTLSVAVLLVLLPCVPGGFAQASSTPSSQSAAPRQSGTVKAATSHDFVMTTTTGQDVPVTVLGNARILLVPPGSKDLSAAQPGTAADIAAGDRVIVSGTPGDPAQMMSATRVIVMKSTAIAARSAADQAAWARGVGGIVRSVDGTGVITVVNGSRTLTVDTTPNTVVRRYAGSSVRFEDAVKSNVASVHSGDQLRARGQRSPDGTTVIADEIVTGSFSNFSGVLTAVDPTAGTVTLKDLASKRTVTVALTAESNVRRLPPGAMAAMAARNGGGDPSHSGAQGAPSDASSGRPPGSERNGPGGGPANGARGGAGMDLSRIMNRLPTETITDLKTGEAVMIVASNGSQSGQPTAITLLAGVEQILAAHPAGETTLSPWSLGSQGEGGGGEGSTPN